jgi:histidine ammonia-lyase
MKGTAPARSTTLAVGTEWSVGDSDLTIDRLREIIESGKPLRLSDGARQRVARSRETVEHLAEGAVALYGINTGFGGLAHQRIPHSDLEQLQENLILSHAVGVGDEVPSQIVRLMLLLKAHGLSLGYSGTRVEVIEYLIRFFNEDFVPIIFTKGSLGASGDLAPLAHLTLPALGFGNVNFRGTTISAKAALQAIGLNPLRLEAKEGLALINGTQFMSAYAVHCLHRIQLLLATADLAAAMTLESIRGSAAPFNARIHEARPHPGQVRTAAIMRQLLTGSEILPSHLDCPKVQDPYSIRCVPQVTEP